MSSRHLVAFLSMLVMASILWVGLYHGTKNWRARRVGRRIAAQRQKARRAERGAEEI
jgi:hypothetical protein